MHLRNRKVSVLRTGGDHIYVNAGLDEGDLVSLTALDSSFAGSKVTIKSTTPSDKLDQHGRSKVEGAEALNTASTSGEADAAMVAGGR